MDMNQLKDKLQSHVYFIYTNCLHRRINDDELLGRKAEKSNRLLLQVYERIAIVLEIMSENRLEIIKDLQGPIGNLRVSL